MLSAFLCMLVGSSILGNSEVASDTLYITCLTGKPPVIDGALDDECWKEALEISDFVQLKPNEGEPPTGKTYCYLTYDSKNLYVAFYCKDKFSQDIKAVKTTRDDLVSIASGDFVVLYLDTYGDRKSAYVFLFNPYGSVADGIATSGSLSEEDLRWDAIVTSEGRITSDGYIVEAMIPLSNFRFSSKETQIWRILIMRSIFRKNENDLFPIVTREEIASSFFDAFASLKGIRLIGRHKLKMNLIPYGTLMNDEVKSMDKFLEVGTRIGGDLRIKIGPNFITDLTISPDFSQVEADVSQIDINIIYPLSYPEKRFFFQEGQEEFLTPIPGGEVGLHKLAKPLDIVYTRRIIDPSFGAKTVGKALGSRIVLVGAKDRGSDAYSPASFFVGRAKRDIWKNAYVGVITTSKEYGDFYNRVGGLDANFKFLKHFDLSLQALGSSSYGDQMEDFDLDYTLQEHKNGSAVYAGLLCVSSDPMFTHTTNLVFKSVSPEFYACTGLIDRRDMSLLDLEHNFQIWIKKYGIRYVELGLGYLDIHNYDFSVLTDRIVSPQLRFQFEKNVSLNLNYNDFMERWAGVDYRGEGFGLTFQQLGRYLSYQIGYNLGDGINYMEGYLGWKQSGVLWGNFRPYPRLQLTLTCYFENFYKERFKSSVYYCVVPDFRINYQFTKEIFGRIILQNIRTKFYKVDVTTDQGFSDLLIGYEYQPGTVFYLGLNLPFNGTEKEFETGGLSVFLKGSYSFGIRK